MHVASAELSPDSKAVLVHAGFSNLGTVSRRFSAPVTLGIGEQVYAVPAASHAPPTVAGGGSQDGVLALVVGSPVDLRLARLTVGDAGHRQAVVPLGSDDGYESLLNDDRSK